ncbi:MAG: DUF1905 domain-containing protein [Acidimicrobiales bacterium]|nr:DUF1905 domain-containing protein [Acidimicrobiales bacterium]
MTFDAELWRHDGNAAWFFVTAPPDAHDKIDAQAPFPRAGFGSVKVEATIGSSTFSTSVFPGKDGFVLPVKKQVRRAEGIDDGDTVRVTLRVVTV